MAQYYVMCSYSYETSGCNGGQHILSLNIKTSCSLVERKIPAKLLHLEKGTQGLGTG